MPEETHVDEDGRVWASYWTLLGFLIRKAQEDLKGVEGLDPEVLENITPEIIESRRIPSGKKMRSVQSNA